jgi:hypothetical protein
MIPEIYPTNPHIYPKSLREFVGCICDEYDVGDEFSLRQASDRCGGHGSTNSQYFEEFLKQPHACGGARRFVARTYTEYRYGFE